MVHKKVGMVLLWLQFFLLVFPSLAKISVLRKTIAYSRYMYDYAHIDLFSWVVFRQVVNISIIFYSMFISTELDQQHHTASLHNSCSLTIRVPVQSGLHWSAGITAELRTFGHVSMVLTKLKKWLKNVFVSR